jgi:hypothetical protein
MAADDVSLATLPPTVSNPGEPSISASPNEPARGKPIPIGQGRRRVNARIIWRRGSRITNVSPPTVGPPPATDPATPVPLTPLGVPYFYINSPVDPGYSVTSQGRSPRAVQLGYNPGMGAQLPYDWFFYYTHRVTDGGTWGTGGGAGWVSSLADNLETISTYGGPIYTGDLTPPPTVIPPTVEDGPSPFQYLVALSAGYRLDPEVAPKLTTIHANGIRIYDSEAGPLPGVSVTFYDGSETQLQDPDMVLQDGADKTPAYRGQIYAMVGIDSLKHFNNEEPAFTLGFEDTATLVYTNEAIGIHALLGFDAVNRVIYGFDQFATRGPGDTIHQLVVIDMDNGNAIKLVKDSIGTNGGATHITVDTNSVYLPWCDKLWVLHWGASGGFGSGGWFVEIANPHTGLVECASAMSSPGFDAFSTLNAGWCRSGTKTYMVGIEEFSGKGTIISYEPSSSLAQHVGNLPSGFGLPSGMISRMDNKVPMLPGTDTASVYALADNPGGDTTKFALMKWTPNDSGCVVTDTGFRFTKNANETVTWRVYGAWYRPSTTSWYFFIGSNSAWAKRRLIELVDPALATARGRAPLDVSYADNFLDNAMAGMISHFNQAIGDHIMVANSPATAGTYRLINLDDGAITTVSPVGAAPQFTFTDGYTFGAITTGTTRLPINKQTALSTPVSDGEGSGEGTLPVADAVLNVATICKLDPENIVIEGIEDIVEGITITGDLDPLDFFNNSARIFGFHYFERGEKVVFKKIDLDPLTVTWADIPLDHRLPIDENGSQLDTDQGERFTPSYIQLVYIDSSMQYQTSDQLARSEATDSHKVLTVETPFIMTAAQASTQAGLMLLETEVIEEAVEHMLPPMYLAMEPTDVVQFGSNGRGYTSKVSAVTFNTDFTIQTEYRTLLTYRDLVWTGYPGEPIPDPVPSLRHLGLSASVGARLILGVAVGFKRGLGLAGSVGAFALSGQPIAFRAPIKLATNTGAFATTGVNTTAFRGRNLAGDAGAYTFTGVSTTLTYTASGPTDGVLLEDGTSFMLLENGTDFALLG